MVEPTQCVADVALLSTRQRESRAARLDYVAVPSVCLRFIKPSRQAQPGPPSPFALNKTVLEPSQLAQL